MRTAAFAASCVLACGCGYVGDPLPPALNIPERIQDLKAVELGDRIVLEFTIPKLTTEHLTIKTLDGIEVEVAGQSFGMQTVANGTGRITVPAEQWVGQTIPLRVRAVSNRKAAAWSNGVTLAVVPPLPKPRAVAAASDARGVRISWQFEPRAGVGYIVLRKGATDKEPVIAGKSNETAFVDTAAEYGKPYSYTVQASAGQALSDVAGPVEITPIDTFAPAVPAGVTANRGVNSIELAWERNTEPDFRTYRVYRAVKGSEPRLLADSVDAPAYSDRQIESGKTYAYSVSSIDERGNESTPSPPLEVLAP